MSVRYTMHHLVAALGWASWIGACSNSVQAGAFAFFGRLTVFQLSDFVAWNLKMWSKRP